MTTRRQDILESIRAAIAGIAGFGDTEVNRATGWGAGTVYPAANVRSGADSLNEDESSLGMDEWDFEPEVDIVTFGEPEELLGQVHEAVMADLTRGGKADHTKRVAAEPNYGLNPPTGAHGLTIKFLVKYEIPEGTA